MLMQLQPDQSHGFSFPTGTARILATLLSPSRYNSSGRPSSPECVELEFYEVQALPSCSGAHTALEHIHSPKTGVCCLRCVASRCHVRAQVSYLHLLLDLGQLPENSIKIDHIQYQSPGQGKGIPP